MSQDSSFNQGSVPQSVREEVLTLTFVMLGLTFFSTNVWTGNTFRTGPSYRDFFSAVLIGDLLLGIYAPSLGYIGVKIGLAAHFLTRLSFSIEGSWLPSLLLGGTQVGWFDTGVVMLSIPVGETTGLDINLLTAVSSLLVAIIVLFSVLALTALSVIAVSAIIYLDGYSVWLAINGMGGLDILKAVIPARPLDLNVAPALVMGSFINVDTPIADFVRFGHNTKLTVLMAMVVFFPGSSLVFTPDAAGTAALGMANISGMMIAQSLLLPAIIVLGLNVWTTNDNALYASDLGFANITSMSSKTLSMINGTIDTICTLWLCNNFVSWLTFLLAAIPPVGGVVIADYLINRRHYEYFVTMRMMDVNWVTILAVALGTTTGHWLPGIVPVNTMLSDALSYLILNPILNHKVTAAVTHMEANSIE